jgi:uncharacterized small protein (TIGR04563 family)
VRRGALVDSARMFFGLVGDRRLRWSTWSPTSVDGRHREVPSVKGDKKKQSLYFPVEMLDEMQREADRQERPLSWIMQQAWKLSRDRIMTYPAVEELNA